MAHLYSPLNDLTLPELIQVARDRKRVQPLDPADTTNERMRDILASAAWVREAMADVERAAVENRDPVAYYGINTGFGDNAGRATFRYVEEAERLSRQILLSHTIGVGEHLPEDVVRAALLIRIASLSRGFSGIRPDVINTLIAMLNRDVYPAVPSQGSLGASGDLAPLAHMVIPISQPLPGEDPDVPGATGHCYVNGKLVTGAEAMAAAGIPQIRLGAKEGISLVNGTAITAAIGALALEDTWKLIQASQIALAMTMEAMHGFRDAYLSHLNRLRNKTQADAANQVFEYLVGSTLVRGAADLDLPASEGPPQDPYSIRCGAVVTGAVLRAHSHVNAVLCEELMAVTDNPLVFASEDQASPYHLTRLTKVISGGNFHGEPLALAMDYLSIAVAELANIAERRVFLLTDPRLNRGLPAFLIAEPPEQAGLNSGLMMAQYTAAALVSENKLLAHPASVDSIPSSANREDHVSMSTIAARKTAQIVANAQRVIAIEMLCASQALSLRLEQKPGKQPGKGARRALEFIRGLEIAPGRTLDVIRQDTPLPPYVAALVAAVQSGALVAYVEDRRSRVDNEH